MRVPVHVRRLAAGAVATAALSALLIAPPGLAAQSAPADAASPAASCPAPDPATPKRQLRAAWIASVVNIDWPSQQGLSAAEQKTELLSWFDEAVDRGFNAVVLQIRPTADAFWPSPYEPWSVWLSGTQGEDPGYDPLAFAVAEAHKRNLEFHAWFNPYRVAMHADFDQLAPDHPARQHPEWIVTYGGRLYYNPGIPEVRQFVQDAIMDAVHNYDVDGVHFDDYFYPYPVGSEQFDDEETYQRYGAGQFPDKGDWRRNNVDGFIAGMGDAIKAAKPWVKFGISPFGIWRNQATDPRGSATDGLQSYDAIYADTRKWVQEEWIDYIVPQIYWNIGFEVADYGVLVPWWSDVVDGTDVQLYIGQANYKVGDPAQPAPWQDPAEMSRHLTFNQDYPQVRGDVYFSAKQVRANMLGHMDLVDADHYSRPALVPEFEQLDGRAPRSPVIIFGRRASDGVRLDWLDTNVRRSQRATSYAVYRVDGARPVGRCDLVDARNLISTVRARPGLRQSFTDDTAQRGTRYSYVVTALDRVYHESTASRTWLVLR